MTAREQINQKPTNVQRVLKAHIAKVSMRDGGPNYEAYGHEALEWWRNVIDDAEFICPSFVKDENAFAGTIIERLKSQPGWKEIFEKEEALHAGV